MPQGFGLGGLRLSRGTASCIRTLETFEVSHSIVSAVEIDYAIDKSEMKELPEEVSNCLNWQTLLLPRKFRVPQWIGKLINLRHLQFHIITDGYLPRGIGRLTRLRTLTAFIGLSSREGASCGCEELKHLDNLQGELRIIHLENEKSVEKAKEAQLHKKQHLRSLHLEYSSSYVPVGNEEERSVEGVVEELKPHPNLEQFQLVDYNGSKLPSRLGHPMFCNLVEVTLHDYKKFQWLPCLGNLPSLKQVRIQGMEEVRYVGSEFCGGSDDSSKSNADGSSNVDHGWVISFPKLEQLRFSHMPNWEW